MRRLIYAWLMVSMLSPILTYADIAEGRYVQAPIPASVETGNKIEVREIFWYGCPHCYVLEPGLTRWLKKLPANAQFVRTPGTASPRWLIHGQAYYTFEALGITKKVHNAFFQAVQEQKAALNDEKGIADFAASHGIDRKKFSETFNSFGVRLKLDTAKQLNQDLNINSVPMIIVDGKYITSPELAHGEASLFEVLDQLISKAAKERKTKAAKPK